MATVENYYGVEIDFDLAVEHMDKELCEELHNKLAPCSEQEFFDAYVAAHEERFDEQWVGDMQSPAW